MKKLFLLSVLALLTSFLNAQTHWTPIDPPGSTGYTATMIGVIKLDGSEQYSNRLEIGVFHGDECRGAGLASTVVSSRNYVFLTVYGIEGEEDTFKIYDHATGAELDASSSQTFIYHDNGNTGTIPSPYVFEFLTNHFVIGVSADPTAGGTVTGGGTYDRDATVNLSATANTGYNFVNWTKDGTQVSTAASFSFAATVATQGDYVAHFTLASCTITATADPTTGGTVSGGGTFTYGSSCTLTASANTGYTFVNWTKNDVQVSDELTYSFTVEETATYVAHFLINSYDVTATVNPTEGGTVSGTGTYDYGTTVTLSATPTVGYHFLNWTQNGAVVTTDNAISFTVTQDTAFVAHFEINNYEITVAADPTTGGTVSGGGTYNHGDPCTLIAAANAGYTFVNWTKGGSEVSTNDTISFVVEGAANYIAHFSLNTYEITATSNPAGGGVITGAGNYNYHETCTLSVTTNTGYTLVNWTKGGVEVTTEPSFSFLVEEDAAYQANFNVNGYEIVATADPAEGGTITGAGVYNHFQTCVLIATANTGYTFVNWTKDGSEVSTNDTISFMVEGGATYVAHFQINSYDVTATVNPAEGGTVSGTGTYDYGTTVTLSATPAVGYHFLNWTQNGTVVTTDNAISFTVTQDTAFVANFEINSYDITATANPTIGGTITGDGTYTHGTTVTLSATPAEGYHFLNWSQNGTVVSTDPAISFTATQDSAFVAHFEINSYEIAVAADPTTGGTVYGAGTYNHFQTCTLIATAGTGYTFVNWTKGGTVISTSATFSFTVVEAGSYVAHFSLNSYDITATANPSEGGTVTGAGTYNHFETCTLTATPADTYFFVNWTKDGEVVSTEPTYTFTVAGTGDYVANFVLGYIDIVAYSAQPDYGEVSGGGTYLVGSTCTLTAIPNHGFRFLQWAKDHEVVSTDSVYSFVVAEAGTYRALFERVPYSITVEVNPAEGGTVTGTGDIFYINTTCQLVATPNDGYYFLNWMKDGEVVSTEYIYEFTVTGSEHFVANFAEVLDIDAMEVIPIVIYPNPAVDKLVVKSPMAIRQCEVYSITGQCLLRMKDCGEMFEIQLGDFVTGSYLIRMTSDNFDELRKFIKE